MIEKEDRVRNSDGDSCRGDLSISTELAHQVSFRDIPDNAHPYPASIPPKRPRTKGMRNTPENTI
jgi:hypothetical protein